MVFGYGARRLVTHALMRFARTMAFIMGVACVICAICAISSLVWSPVWSSSVWANPEQGDQADLNELVQALNSDDLSTRNNAAAALERLGEAAIPALAELVENVGGTPYFARWHAVRVLGAIPSPNSALVLSKAMQDENSQVRQAAAASLRNLKIAIRRVDPKRHVQERCDQRCHRRQNQLG
ncbi:MAG: HEAT repeat domain-containing protein [Firmicutes bacterium]|nr:HEAT repeat domain-containing protein [Bacillota bacterium]